MSKGFIDQEIKKIMNDAKLVFPKNVAMAAAWIVGNFKGYNLKIFDVSKKSSLADFYVIGSATNPTQAQAMAEEIYYQMKHNDVPINSFEGRNGADWMLIDLGSVIVHIFLETSRGVFDLDTLWSSHPQLEIPEDYYHALEGENLISNSTDNGDEGFF